MKRVLLTLAIALLSGSLFFSIPTSAQLVTPASRAARVQITQGPELELARNNWAIIRWTSNNPGGTDDHWGVVHYGTDPRNLSQIAKSHIRLNQSHPDTIFRVRVLGLNPGTTYYYKVDSIQATGQSDGVKSPVERFTTLQ
jgi:phosphodiesterase/alkaline phosphatase D-like protein